MRRLLGEAPGSVDFNLAVMQKCFLPGVSWPGTGAVYPNGMKDLCPHLCYGCDWEASCTTTDKQRLCGVAVSEEDYAAADTQLPNAVTFPLASSTFCGRNVLTPRSDATVTSDKPPWYQLERLNCDGSACSCLPGCSGNAGGAGLQDSASTLLRLPCCDDYETLVAVDRQLTNVDLRCTPD